MPNVINGMQGVELVKEINSALDKIIKNGIEELIMLLTFSRRSSILSLFASESSDTMDSCSPRIS